MSLAELDALRAAYVDAEEWMLEGDEQLSDVKDVLWNDNYQAGVRLTDCS